LHDTNVATKQTTTIYVGGLSEHNTENGYQQQLPSGLCFGGPA